MGGEETRQVVCGEDGCLAVRYLAKAAEKIIVSSNELTVCVNTLNTNVELQNQRLETGDRRFDAIESDVSSIQHTLDGVDNKPGLKTEVEVLKVKKTPTRVQSASWGAGLGGAVAFLLELLFGFGGGQ